LVEHWQHLDLIS